MTNKRFLTTAVVLLLGAACFFLYKDRFLRPDIHVTHRSIQPRGAFARQTRNWPADPVVFLFNRELKLTEVKVLALSDAQKDDKSAVPLWHLVSDSSSPPIESFAYGLSLRGMKPAKAGTQPQPLQPGTAYRLYITAGRIKAEHDFTPSAPKS
jgi:hypothetical protein